MRESREGVELKSRSCDPSAERVAGRFASSQGLPTVALEGDREGPAFAAKPLWPTFACDRERRLVDQNSASWNRVSAWLRRLEGLKIVAA